ncbi:methyltransferase domain-containing protein [Streptomyces scopuliridis]|uniref:methyltransferase domain-containing protein n=1 Tax=Streptomyces scopuliridis TaxID=452529 RepID=UPI0036BFB83E
MSLPSPVITGWDAHAGGFTTKLHLAVEQGCGAGHYAAELLAGGAEVVGIDGSATLLSHARVRLGDRAELRMTARRSRWTSSTTRRSTESCVH